MYCKTYFQMCTCSLSVNSVFYVYFENDDHCNVKKLFGGLNKNLKIARIKQNNQARTARKNQASRFFSKIEKIAAKLKNVDSNSIDFIRIRNLFI